MLQRDPANPILTRADIPDVPPALVDPTSVFNPGAIEHDGRVVLLLRVQTRGRRTVLMTARSNDGRSFRVVPEIIRIRGLDEAGVTIHHIYDPRLTRIGETVFVVFAADTDDACLLGIASTPDMRRFELVSLGTGTDTRNGVLLPERIGGRFLRLERPNLLRRTGEPPSGSRIILSESDDLTTWRPIGPVMAGRPRLWDELIGSGPPPIKTRRGWLHVYHGVATHFASVNIYQAGAVLLDLEDPRRVISRTRDNILEPRELYELTGQVPNVVFPSGMVVRDTDDEGFARPESEVLIYYGAADTVVGLATTTVKQLIAACEAG